VSSESSELRGSKAEASEAAGSEGGGVAGSASQSESSSGVRRSMALTQRPNTATDQRTHFAVRAQLASSLGSASLPSSFSLPQPHLVSWRLESAARRCASCRLQSSWRVLSLLAMLPAGAGVAAVEGVEEASAMSALKQARSGG
jgi:hypothetical protein